MRVSITEHLQQSNQTKGVLPRRRVEAILRNYLDGLWKAPEGRRTPRRFARFGWNGSGFNFGDAEAAAGLVGVDVVSDLAQDEMVEMVCGYFAA